MPGEPFEYGGQLQNAEGMHLKFNSDTRYTQVMLSTALLAATLTVLTQQAQVILTPTDDVWVYPHAADPAKDTRLLVWGSGGSMPAPGEDEQSFSYGLLRFDAGKLPQSALVNKIELILTHLPKPAFDAKVSKEFPVEVRPLLGELSEKTWSYDKLATIRPESGKDAVLAKGFAETIPSDLAFEVKIMLASDSIKAGEVLKRVVKGFQLGFALTSSLDPGALDGRPTYRFYSNDAEEKLRPRLVLSVTKSRATK